MPDYLMDELNQALADKQMAQSIHRHLEHLDHQIRLAKLELERLAALQEKEYLDFEQLSKMNIRGVFQKILGSREKQLEKEKQEYLRACLLYNDASKVLKLMLFEKSVLLEKLNGLHAIEQKIVQLSKERERRLLDSDNILGKKLLAIAQEMDALRYKQREVIEAASVGEEADQLLNKMTRYLKEAKNWGDWISIGKPDMEDYVKDSYIDKARGRAHQAGHLLKCFSDELNDVYGAEQIEALKLTEVLMDFYSFTHAFSDNLIADWLTQQKIKLTLDNVLSIQQRLFSLLQALEREEQQLSRRLDELESEKRRIIRPN